MTTSHRNYSPADLQKNLRPLPHFLIVGTPRSGTTLLQRLVCELPSVYVPPETHFLSLFIREMLSRVDFPLYSESYVQEVRRFLSLSSSAGLNVDAEVLVRKAGGICLRPIDMFGAVLRELAGPVTVVGEKTPNHLLWWRPLSRALPDTKFIAIVRDPRAVVSSGLRVPFGMKSPVVLAEKWALDQREVAIAEGQLGASRWLTVRYEDAIEDPDAVRSAVSRFLMGRDTSEQKTKPLAGPIYLPWERWKSSALGPIHKGRAGAWRQELSPEHVRAVVAICRREMSRLGYEGGRTRAPLRPMDVLRRAHYRVARRSRMRWIDSVQL